jgi:molybdopterin synthase sulfur carrier subunit
MKVNFFATLREITRQKTVEFDLPEGSTVGQLVDAVIFRFPLMHDVLLNQEGNLWGHVHVFINGRDVPFLENQMATVIKPSDAINIFPAVGGG